MGAASHQAVVLSARSHLVLTWPRCQRCCTTLKSQPTRGAPNLSGQRGPCLRHWVTTRDEGRRGQCHRGWSVLSHLVCCAKTTFRN